MKFSEAMEALHAGKYVSRDAWDVSCEYVVLMPGMQYIWKILTQPNPNAGNYLPLVADLVADDWKAIDKIPSQVVEAVTAL